MSAYIPQDLVLEVLPWLPLKSLIRFRSVSNYWATLIGTPDYFSKCIINDCILVNPTHPLLLVKRALISTDGRLSYSYLCYSTLAFASESHQDLPLQGPRDIAVVGSCNGFLCIFDYIETGNIVVWNPTTVELMIFPPVSEVGTVFFGFDPIHDEFKVMRIRYALFHSPESEAIALDREVEVYSLSGGSWRNLVVDIEVPDLREHDPAYTNSVCFWLALNCTGGEKVIAFDVCDEAFRTTALPDASLVESYRENWRTLKVLKESVALLVFPCEDGGEESFLDIWVLLEFGVKESWIRLVRIVPICCNAWPLGFWKKGELLMEIEGELVLYDPFAQSVRNLQLDGECFQVLPSP
ncbi:hypothetical protein F2P56_022540 [Juglans regia]|uniref:F-box only protein 8-like n=2 Tax=Juglans regia TaxID=51240 RepID=A0A2I4GHR2_JUGRE|nr:F-box only protein 8-like [Juglans regia]KAF5458517.1 hypothetical protein F2P56_022540 [Juglans regia]